MRSTLVRVAVLGVLLALAGCGGGPAARITQSPYSPYVALGDSYTAAPLIPEQSTDGCFRSSRNYPSLVADELHIAEFVDRSCGGAQTTDMTQSERPGIAPQFDALDRGTRLVTIGVGGNDFEIAATLYTQCRVLATRAPAGAPCRAAMQRNGTDRLLSRMPDLQDRMARLLAQIHQRSPRAKVLVVGYPQSVPANGTCRARLPIATGDYAYVREVIEAVNTVLQDATRSAGDTWIDVWRASAGHDICSAKPWVNGATTELGVAAALHPLAVEQAAVARLVVRALRSGG
jgi:hypothetical protein